MNICSKFFGLRWPGQPFIFQSVAHLTQERAYGWLVACADLGVLESKPRPDAADGAHDDPSSYSAGKKEALKIKKGCKNLAKTALNFYINPASLQKEELIAAFTGPLHKWHKGHQLARSGEEVFAWALGQCDGGFFEHIRATLAVLHSTSILQPCGFTETSAAPDRSPSDCACAFQDGIALQCGLMCAAMVESRLSWGMDFVEGFPKRSILFSNRDTKASKQDVVAQFRRQCDVIDSAARLERPAKMREWASRSHMRWTPVVQIRHCLRDSGFAVTPRFADFALRRNMALRLTQAVEEGNKYQMAAVRKSANKRIRDVAAMEALVESPVLHEIHRYKAIGASTAIVPRAAALDAGVFRISYNGVWTELRKIPGKSETAPWYSPGPNGQNSTIGELKALEVLVDLAVPPSAAAVGEFLVSSVC